VARDAEGDGAGNYTISMQRTCDPGNATPVMPGQIIMARIDLTSEMDAYTFAADRNDRVKVHMGTSWSRGPQLLLFAENGSLVGSSGYGYYDSPASSDLTVNIPDRANYTLLARDGEGDNTGNYTLSLRMARPSQLIIGHTLSDFAQPDDLNAYNVSVAENESLLVQITPEDPVATLLVYGAFGHIPSPADYDYVQPSKNSRGAYDLLISPTAEGNYFIGVYASSGNPKYAIRATVEGDYLSSYYPAVLTNYSEEVVQVYGLGFAGNMSVELANSTYGTIRAQRVVYSSPTSLTAYFNLSDARFGNYNVSVIWPDGHGLASSPRSPLQSTGRGSFTRKTTWP
jgi:hypothetical protein